MLRFGYTGKSVLSNDRLLDKWFGDARESKLCTISSFTLVPHNLSFDGTDFPARVSRMLRLKKELAYHAHRVCVSLGRCSHVRVDVCRWCGQRRPQRSSQSDCLTQIDKRKAGTAAAGRTKHVPILRRTARLKCYRCAYTDEQYYHLSGQTIPRLKYQH